MLRFGLLLCVAGLVVGGPSASKTREEIETFRQYLEQSRTENGVRVDSKALSDLQGNIWENSGKFQGDIVLDNWQIEALVTDYAAGRAAYIWPNTKWPNNVVVYDFGVNEFNAAQQLAILNSINLIERNSCVRFRRRNANDRDFVLLTGRSDGCYANVGFWAGRGIHIMNLARDTPGRGCFMPVVIVHEWLHILGFFHMQSTYNRDNYVRIHFENIVDDMAYNFYRYGANVVSNLGLPYEYTSCMHYTTHAFSKNGRPTIVALRAFSGIMGQVERVTDLDWLRLRRHYNCPGAWSFAGIEHGDNEQDLVNLEQAEISGVIGAEEAEEQQ
ncbi:unnamed protein product, partial [Brenthis ino]